MNLLLKNSFAVLWLQTVWMHRRFVNKHRYGHGGAGINTISKPKQCYLFVIWSFLGFCTLDTEGAGVKEVEVVGVVFAGLTTSVDGTVWGTDWEMVCILVPLLTGDSKFKTLPFFRGVEDRTEDSWLIISVSCSGLLSLASRFWILARKQKLL